jgi:hypothetical protein
MFFKLHCSALQWNITVLIDIKGLEPSGIELNCTLAARNGIMWGSKS